jgi:hypothetical protein
MKTYDLSGMGGGYEYTCQKMMWAGVEAMKEFGIPVSSAASDRAKKIEELIIKASDNDCTGAMFGAALSGAFLIAKNPDTWLEKVKEHDASRIYDWDGTVNTVPKTDLSKEMEAK